jgi:hypothetical protein
MVGAPVEDFRVGGALGEAFSVISRAPGPFLALSLIASLPTLLQLMIFRYPADLWTIVGLANVLGAILGFIVQGALVYGTFRQVQGQRFTLGGSLTRGLARFFPLLGAGIVSGIVIALGLVALVIPGIMVFCAYYVAAPVCVVERLGPFGSLGRSAQLTKGYRWRIFGLAIVVVGLSALAGYLVRVVLLNSGNYVAAIIAEYLVDTISTAFGSVLAAIVYYRLRASKEGVNLDAVASVFD